MKKVLHIFLIIVLTFSVFSLLFTVFAHPGSTDENGGHYNRSTGEYHYHHGHPEHQHENGICPYDFDDQTGQNSGPSSSGSSYSSEPYSVKKTSSYETPYNYMYSEAYPLPEFSSDLYHQTEILIGLSIVFSLILIILNIFLLKGRV